MQISKVLVLLSVAAVAADENVPAAQENVVKADAEAKTEVEAKKDAEAQADAEAEAVTEAPEAEKDADAPKDAEKDADAPKDAEKDADTPEGDADEDADAAKHLPPPTRPEDADKDADAAKPAAPTPAEQAKRADLNKKTDEFNKKQDASNVLVEQANAATKKLEKFQQDLNAEKEALSKLEKALSEAKSDADKAEAKKAVEAKKEAIAALEKEYEAEKASSAELKAKADKSIAELETLKAEIDTLKAEIEGGAASEKDADESEPKPDDKDAGNGEKVAPLPENLEEKLPENLEEKMGDKPEKDADESAVDHAEFEAALAALYAKVESKETLQKEQVEVIVQNSLAEFKAEQDRYAEKLRVALTEKAEKDEVTTEPSFLLIVHSLEVKQTEFAVLQLIKETENSSAEKTEEAKIDLVVMALKEQYNQAEIRMALEKIEHKWSASILAKLEMSVSGGSEIDELLLALKSGGGESFLSGQSKIQKKQQQLQDAQAAALKEYNDYMKRLNKAWMLFQTVLPNANVSQQAADDAQADVNKYSKLMVTASIKLHNVQAEIKAMNAKVAAFSLTMEVSMSSTSVSGYAVSGSSFGSASESKAKATTGMPKADKAEDDEEDEEVKAKDLELVVEEPGFAGYNAEDDEAEEQVKEAAGSIRTLAAFLVSFV